MKNVTLERFVVRNVEFINNVEGSMKLELKNRHNYNVDYNEDVTKCRSRLIVDIRNEPNDSLLRVRVEIWGYFQIGDLKDKAKIHCETYDQIFPQARAYIASLTAMAGIAPLMAIPMELNPENVSLQAQGSDPIPGTSGTNLKS